MRFIVAGAVAAAVVAFLSVTAGAAAPRPTFVFGRTGGTIVPFKVVIGSDGSVSVTGPVRRLDTVTVSQEALAALRVLTNAEAFASMPKLIRCRGTVAGIATRYIRAPVGSRARTVYAYGRCNKRFDGLYEVLEGVAAVTTTPR